MAQWETKTGKDIHQAAQWIREGEVVAIPTETVYGLAANALDDDAVRKIFAVKNRPFFNPLIVHIGDPSWVSRYVTHLPERAKTLADNLWPGPLTLVLPKRDVISDLVTAGHDTVAIRVPGHLLTLSLLQELDLPLAAPSANPFGYISPTTAGHVYGQLAGKLPYILDGGPCEIGVESTIVGFDGDQAQILRYGGVPVEEVEALIGPVLRPGDRAPDAPLLAPGMLKSHYAPRKRLYFGDIRTLLDAGHFQVDKVGVLSFSSKVEGVPEEHQIVLSLEGDLDLAAQRLFEALHTLDQMPVELILAEEFPAASLGLAINDRLRRAAHKE